MPRHLKRFRLIAIMAMLAALIAGCSTTMGPKAVKSTSETAWQFHDIVGIDMVKKYAVMPQPEGVLIIDARPYKPKYINGYIPTAISMPFSKFDKMTDKLPKDKNTLLIFYCGGPT